jgi:iron-sulfur cluster assembly protein
MTEPILSLTPEAVRRVRHLVQTRGEGALGLRLGVKPMGCSGLTYQLDFAREIGEEDEVVEVDGVRVVVDGRARHFLVGTEMHFVEDRLGASFVFRNPLEKSRCGCGESFKV